MGRTMTKAKMIKALKTKRAEWQDTIAKASDSTPHETPPEHLAQVIKAVASGQPMIDSSPATQLLPLDPLTPREQEVLRLLATGETNKAIARRLGITDHTVKFHLNAIMTKLGAQRRTDTVARAVRAGLLTL